MADPYRIYASTSPYRREPQVNYSAHVPPESSYYASRMAALRGESDIPRNDVVLQSRAYGMEGSAGVTHPALIGLAAPPAGGRAQGPSPAGVTHPALTGVDALPAGARVTIPGPMDPAIVRRSSPVGKSASIPDVEPPITVQPNPLLNIDGPSEDESNILFVDGLPTDCTRREVAHLFRPFVGFKDLRLVHKEPRRSGDKAYVLCFVEFSDAKCAFTAMQALQEYRFDERKPDAPVLKIQFARFPFHPPAVHDRKRPSAR